MKNFMEKTFDLFDKGWALVTAGDMDSFNTMTISWGGLGTLWNRPVATVYVKPIRYTHNFMESNEYFTVSFFDTDYRADLATLGTLSGKDGDKVAKTQLTPVTVGESVSFKEAKLTRQHQEALRLSYMMGRQEFRRWIQYNQSNGLDLTSLLGNAMHRDEDGQMHALWFDAVEMMDFISE